MKLNLGCKSDIRKGYFNLDKVDLDLNKFPYNIKGRILKSDIAEEILLYRVIDHLDNPEEVLIELKKILSPQGKLKIIVSHMSRSDAYNLRHKYQTNHNSLIYILEELGFRVVYSRIIFGKTYKIFEPLFNRYKKVYEFSFLHHLIPAIEIKVVCQK